METLIKIGEWTKRNKYEILYWLVFIILIFIMGLRDISVGTDNKVYKIIYENIIYGKTSFRESSVEIGFTIFCFILGKLGVGYYGFQFIVAVIVNLSFGLFIHRFSKNKFLSLFLYVVTGIYFSAFNIVRQQLALCICLFAIYLVWTNKKMWWAYLLLVLLASTFHLSTLIFLPLIIVFYKKFNNVHIIALFAIATIFMAYCEPICTWLSKTFYIKYLEKYINTKYFKSGFNTRSFLLTMGYVIALVGICIYEKLCKIKIDNAWSKYIYVMFVLIKYCSLFGCFSLLFSRVSSLFSFGIIILIPELIHKTNNKILRIILTVASMVIFTVIIILQLIVFKQMDIFPYKFIFN